MFWQFLELFVQHNNNMVIDYSPNKKFKHLVELKKTIETTLQKFKDSLATCKTAYEKSMLQSSFLLT